MGLTEGAVGNAPSNGQNRDAGSAKGKCPDVKARLTLRVRRADRKALSSSVHFSLKNGQGGTIGASKKGRDHAVFTELKPGGYTAKLEPKGEEENFSIRPSHPFQTTLEAGADETYTLLLRQTTMRVSIVDGDTNKPVAAKLSAKVRGRYLFEKRAITALNENLGTLDPGDYRLNVLLEGRAALTYAPVPETVVKLVEGADEAVVIKLWPMLLELKAVDHHFVPTRAGSDNDLQMMYNIRGLANDTVILRVTSATHNPPIVCERTLSAGEKRDGTGKVLRWNGVTTCTSGPLQGKLINPLFGPYDVELVHRTLSTNKLQTRVLYRDVRLERLPWADAFMAVTGLPAAAFPAAGTDDQKRAWLVYKLNELGYPAGPLSARPSKHPLMRALFRYTQEHPQFVSIFEFDTLTAGAPGKSNWGWCAKWEAQFTAYPQLFQSPLAAGVNDLVTRLGNDEQRRPDPLDDPEAIAWPSTPSRVVLDHDIFYLNKDFLKEDAHAAYDKEFMNRWVLPLRAKVLLLARADTDASQPGVESPEAVGAVDCEWKVFDPIEDVSMVPTPTQANVPLKTKARVYIDTVHRKIGRDTEHPLDAQDNCPIEYGGVRPEVAKDMTDYFVALAPACATRTEESFRRFTQAGTNPAHPALLGSAGVQFHGSYIAGDNYVIQVRLVLAKLPGGAALETEHKNIGALAAGLATDTVLKPADPRPALVAQTGTLTLWRRTRVAQVLDWGPLQSTPVDWFRIIDNFRAAHVILVPPAAAPARLDTVLLAPAKQALAAAQVQDAQAGNLSDPNKTEFAIRAAQAAFNPEGFHPLPLRTLAQFEAATEAGLKEAHPPGTTPKARFARYTSYLSKLIAGGYPGYSYMVGSAREIRKGYDANQHLPGVIIVRANYLPKPDFSVLLPPDVARATRDEQKAFNPVRGVSTGMDYGVVFLDNDQGARFSDDFFYTHEISHCLFGSHPFETSSKDDHDRAEKNCLMYYGTNNGGAVSGWGQRVPPAEEYGLELRFAAFDGPPRLEGKEYVGNDLKGVESYGRMSGKFEKLNSYTYKVSGSFDKVQKAVQELKIEPQVILTDRSKPAPANPYITLFLFPSGMGPTPADGDPFPIWEVLKADRAAVRPWQQRTFKPLNLKDNEPRFCGKCLFKLRGWKIRTVDSTGGTTDPDPLPPEALVYPVKPKMEFVRYRLEEGSYLAQVGAKQEFVKLGVGMTDPQNNTLMLGPLRFIHEHKLTWQSSDGNLASLKGILTREWVKYRSPAPAPPSITQAPPFNYAADPDQEYYQGEADASLGEGFDDHSIRWPALICAFPLAAGTLTGEQWYQYKMPGEDWVNFPGAAFLLEKTVYRRGLNWFIKFKKTNWAPHNNEPFTFEIHYRIFPQPASLPVQMNNYTATPAKPHRTANGGIILQTGAHKIGTSTEANSIHDTDLAELERLGYLAPRPWP